MVKMSIGDDVNTVSGYVSSIQSLASATNDLQQSTEMLSEFGKLAKYTSGLGILGAGLALLTSLVVGESDTDRILNAIDKLSTQVEELGNRMDANFERLENVVKQSAARVQILPGIARLNSLKQQMSLLSQETDQNGPGAKIIRETLRSFSEASILEAVETIKLTMADTQFANNVLEATYSTTYGSLKSLNDIAAGLFSYLVLAATGYGLVMGLGNSDDDMNGHDEGWVTSIANNVDRTFSEKLTDAHSAWARISQKCVNDMADNVDAKTRRLIDQASNRSDHKETANYLKDELSDHFFWSDWIVIVYNPITESGIHSMYGWSYKCFFRYRDLNVVVKWVDKTIEAKGANRPHGSMANEVIEFYIQVPTRMPAELAQFFDGTQSATSLAKDLLTPLRCPGFVWRCVRYRGVHASWTNSERVLWKDGYSSLCIFE